MNIETVNRPLAKVTYPLSSKHDESHLHHTMKNTFIYQVPWAEQRSQEPKGSERKSDNRFYSVERTTFPILCAMSFFATPDLIQISRPQGVQYEEYNSTVAMWTWELKWKLNKAMDVCHFFLSKKAWCTTFAPHLHRSLLRLLSCSVNAFGVGVHASD